MKAAVLRRHGGPECVTVEDVPDPEPTPDGVLVEIRAVGVSRTLDLWIREGGGMNVSLPRILGNDPVGVVVDVGSSVVGFLPGDEVMVLPTIVCGQCDFCHGGLPQSCTDAQKLGVHRDGGWAELLNVPEHSLVKKPSNVSFPQATTLAVSYATAWHLLARRVQVGPTDTVLVQGASGALGIACIQVAKLHGARTLAVVGSEAKARSVRELGADAAIVHTREVVDERVRELTDGRGVEIVCDSVGGAFFPRSLASLAVGGTLLVAGAHAGIRAEVDLQSLYARQQSILGTTGRTHEDIRAVVTCAAQGRWDFIIDSVHPLADVVAAQRRMENRESFGKVVIEPWS
jgi:NADPH:quinone reductase-like Zn-dependent oxidoreductase